MATTKIKTTGTDLISTSTTSGVISKGDGTTAGTLQLNCENNTHSIKIKSPLHASAASYTLTLPTTDGDANEFLQSNGSGVLTWAGAASIAWQSVVTGTTLTAVAGRGYPINTTSNACTVTLPGSASVGDQIVFKII